MDHGLAAAKLEMTIPSTQQIQYDMNKEIFDRVRPGLDNKHTLMSSTKCTRLNHANLDVSHFFANLFM